MLGGRKLYKTKLCLLYRTGRCFRPNCNFAHGDAELRRFSGGPSLFNGRRDSRNGDLRDKLVRRGSPNRRYSPERYARSDRAFHPQKPFSRDRGDSHSRSPVQRSERGYRKKQHVDGETDDSESQKISDSPEDPRKEEKVSRYDKIYDLEEQLKQVHSEIERLENRKSLLQSFLEEKIVEERRLSSRVEDLEMQLNKEQEDCRRITSKIKKFLRAYQRYMKAQEELKRSQARLQRSGDQLGSDISKPGAHEEDSSINVPSDEEFNGDKKTSPRNDELKHDTLSLKGRPCVLSTTSEQTRVGDSWKRRRFSGLITRSEKTLTEGAGIQSENDNKERESKKTILNKNMDKSLSDDHRRKRGKNNNGSTATISKGSDALVRVLPSTSIAAYAVDELIEALETDRSEDMEGAADNENGIMDTKASYLPPPPPPPIDLNVYKQYEGDDEDVDVEKVDSEMFHIDLNGEVEIE